MLLENNTSYFSSGDGLFFVFLSVLESHTISDNLRSKCSYKEQNSLQLYEILNRFFYKKPQPTQLFILAQIESLIGFCCCE